jgi:hypothetical protein
MDLEKLSSGKYGLFGKHVQGCCASNTGPSGVSINCQPAASISSRS